MRYIDDMIRSIPLEEMTGGTDMDNISKNNENEIKGIIPDEQPRESKPVITVNKAADTPAPEPAVAAKPIGTKPARVKSRSMGIIAAAVAVVVGAGGVLTYLGASKGVGPMASVFSEEASDGANAGVQNKNDASDRAKTLFITLSGWIADKISDGKNSEIVPGQVIVDFAAIAGGDKDYEQQLRSDSAQGGMMAYYASEIPQELSTLLAAEEQLRGGEIAYYIDPDTLKPLWAQWRSDSGSVVGQYPRTTDDAVFGEFTTDSITTQDISDTMNDGYYKDDILSSRKWTENMSAKLVYTTINGAIADLISDGRISEVPIGAFSSTLAELGDKDDLISKVLYTACVTDQGLDPNSEAAYYIDPTTLKPTCAQWRESKDSPVGQYPYPEGDLEFGKFCTDVPEGQVSVFYGINIKGLSSVQDSQGMEADTLLKETADTLIAEMEKAEAVTPDESLPELYGPMPFIRFYDAASGKTYDLQSSDRQDADVIINGKYCNSEYCAKYLDDLIGSYYDGSWSAHLFGSEDNFNGQEGMIPDDSQLEKARKWYEDFLAAGYQPAEFDPQEQVDADEMKSLIFTYNDQTVTLVNTKFSGANIQVNGRYYNVEDISVLDIAASEPAVEELEIQTDSGTVTDYLVPDGDGMVSKTD